MENIVAIETANRKYKYNQLFFQNTLNDIIQEAHKFNCEKNKWDFKPLIPGAFGYDNLAICLGNSFTKILQDLDTNTNANYNQNINNNLTLGEEIAELVHKSWIENYTYWRDNKPWETNNTYRPPYSPIGDERRNKLAETPYSELPQEEKDKDLIIAEFINVYIVMHMN